MKYQATGIRKTTNIVVAAILYGLCLLGVYFFLKRFWGQNTGLPNIYKGAGIIVFSLLPAVSIVIFSNLVRNLVNNNRQKKWGSKIAFKLILIVFLAALSGFLPATLIYGTMAVETSRMYSSESVRQAVLAGNNLALEYYQDRNSALEALALMDYPPALEKFGPSAEQIRDSLLEREEDLAALELFQGNRSISFSGNPELTLTTPLPEEDDVFLPRFSHAGTSYIRYIKQGNIAAVITMALSPQAEQDAFLLSKARSALLDSANLAGSARLYALVFAISLVFPLLVLAMVAAQAGVNNLLEPFFVLSSGIRTIESAEQRINYLSKPGDESGEMIGAVNTMLDRLEKSRGDELRNERMGAWRDIARRLAHELRNPLTPIRLTAERVLKLGKENPQRAEEILEKSMLAIIQETAGMETLLSEFRDFTRLPEPSMDWLNLGSLVATSAHLYSAKWPKMQLDFSEIDPELRILADKRQISQLLGNMISNAAEACSGEGSIIIHANLVKAMDSIYCRIQISDTGSGIGEEYRNRVFSPYFSTKPEGTGLGLAIVEHIVSSHGGKIWFDSMEGEGTSFYIDIPASAGKGD